MADQGLSPYLLLSFFHRRNQCLCDISQLMQDVLMLLVSFSVSLFTDDLACLEAICVRFFHVIFICLEHAFLRPQLLVIFLALFVELLNLLFVFV